MTGEINKANIPWYLAEISTPVVAGIIGMVLFLAGSMIYVQTQGLNHDTAAARESAQKAMVMEQQVSNMQMQKVINSINNHE